MIERVRVSSETSDCVSYVVTFVGDEPVACTCPHYHFRGVECKHIRAARAAEPLTQAQVVRARELLRKLG